MLLGNHGIARRRQASGTPFPPYSLTQIENSFIMETFGTDETGSDVIQAMCVREKLRKSGQENQFMMYLIYFKNSSVVKLNFLLM